MAPSSRAAPDLSRKTFNRCSCSGRVMRPSGLAGHAVAAGNRAIAVAAITVSPASTVAHCRRQGRHAVPEAESTIAVSSSGDSMTWSRSPRMSDIENHETELIGYFTQSLSPGAGSTTQRESCAKLVRYSKEKQIVDG